MPTRLQKMEKLLFSRNKESLQGKTILVVTHEEDIAKMCKRVVRLKDGVIVDDKKINQKVL